MFAVNHLIGFGSGGDGGNDSYTKLLMHFNEANGVTTFVDSSASARTVTTVGNTVASNLQATLGNTTSCKFDGTSDYLTVPNSADFEFGSAAFTVDWWEYRTSNNAGCPALAREDVTIGPWLFGYDDGAGAIQAFGQTTTTWDLLNGVSMGTTTLNSWIHYAISRDTSNIYTFQNGVQKSITTTSAAFLASANPLIIGRATGATNTFPGHMQEMRVSKGVCRWAGGSNGVTYFTPPTSPYTA